jgi:ankyrin repeat protein
MFAAKAAKREVVELLLKNGADVSAKDTDGWTALVRAAYNREVVELLLKSGADVAASLVMCARASESDVLKFLLDTCGEHLKPSDVREVRKAAYGWGVLPCAACVADLDRFTSSDLFEVAKRASVTLHALKKLSHTEFAELLKNLQYNVVVGKRLESKFRDEFRDEL